MKNETTHLEFRMNNGDILKIDTWWDEFEEISNSHADTEFISLKDISGNKVLIKLASISHINEK